MTIIRRFMPAGAAFLLCGAAAAGEWEFGASLGAELRVFPEEPAFPDQFETWQPSLVGDLDIRWESDDRTHQVVVIPFGRLDSQDDERTHLDLREGYYRYIGDDFEVLAGAAKIFWGVAESRHLVDIINQVDAVEDIDEEDKLGQPMLKASFFRDWGQVDLFYLPYFRERPFNSLDGRLRFPFRPDTDNPVYDQENEEWAPSFAARYAHFIGAWDISLNAFHGTSREPRFLPDVDGIDTGAPQPLRFLPVYDEITQLGATAQYTNNAWLWKAEALVREGQGDTFAAFVGGFEYTFFGVTQSGGDLGMLAEYLYDGREEEVAPPMPFENDLFLGSRYALNDIQDTSILAGVITDLEDGSMSGLVEAERRLGQNWTGELEARFFTNIDDGNLLEAFEQDSHFTVRLTRYF